METMAAERRTLKLGYVLFRSLRKVEETTESDVAGCGQRGLKESGQTL